MLARSRSLVSLPRPLEADLDAPMSDRLLAGAERACASLGSEAELGSRFAPRAEQRRVLDDAAAFLLDAATAPDGDLASRCGRVVLPPRTGKTVIAGHVIARSRLAALVVVPTRTLVEQTARELSAQLPDVALATWFGEARELAPGGVHVTTYAMLRRAFDAGAIPRPIARSALIFFDEAHHTLTAGRTRLVHEAFDPCAARIALTATPDYDPRRTLCRTFPALVHEITLEEALSLSLLAPLRFWVAEVDSEGSGVRIVAGDYDEETLGRVMSGVPFFEAALRVRYAQANARRPALVACASRQQAHDLSCHWRAHRPSGAPPPALILGETPSEERERTLAAFERGEIDTIIQVAVLLEGWTSARCKLLVDLAPSLSRVRATQKYFRVMTRSGPAEARIYVLLPRDLPALPILPHELFGPSLAEYECGTLVGRTAGESGATPLDRSGAVALRGLRIRSRIVYRGRLEAPRLDRNDDASVRAVLRSQPRCARGRFPGLFELRGLWFEHPLFRGRGDALLRWLGVAPTRRGYVEWLAGLWPERAADLVLAYGRSGPEGEGEPADGEPRLGVDVEEPDPELAVPCAELERDVAWWLLAQIPVRQRRVIAQRFGLCGYAPLTYEEIGALDGGSRERIRQVEAEGLARMRKLCADGDDGVELRRRLRGPAFVRPLAPPPFAEPSGFDRWRPLDPPLAIEHLPDFARRLNDELSQRGSLEPEVELHRFRGGFTEGLWARVQIGVATIAIERRKAAAVDASGLEREVCSEYARVEVGGADSPVLELLGREGCFDSACLIVPRGRRRLTDAAARALDATLGRG